MPSCRHLAPALPYLPTVPLALRRREAITTTIRCDCGFEVEVTDEPTLVRTIQEHAEQAHHMQFSTEQALLAAFRAELGDLTSD